MVECSGRVVGTIAESIRGKFQYTIGSIVQIPLDMIPFDWLRDSTPDLSLNKTANRLGIGSQSFPSKTGNARRYPYLSLQNGKP